MRDHEAGALPGTFTVHRDSNTGGLGAKQACAQLKNGSQVFRSLVHLSHMLYLPSASRSLIIDVSACNVICRHHDDPMNGPMGDPSMVKLPLEP